MSKNTPFHLALVSFSVAIGAAITAPAQDHGDGHDHSHAKTAQEQKQEFAGDPYLLPIDPVTAKKLGPVADQVIIQHEGRELRFGTEKSAQAFRSDPAKVLARIDKAMIRKQLAFYPSETCPVSGEELGEMGEPVDLIYRNRLVRLCCNGCKKSFHENPGKVVAELDKSVIKAQMSEYPLQTCLVSGEKLGGEMGDPIDYVIGNRLVRLCCKGCKKKVAKDPLQYLAKLDKASESSASHRSKADGHDHDHGGHK